MRRIFLLVVLLFALPAVLAVQGLEITVYLDDVVYIGTTYTKLFKIKNLDHVSGETDHINVTCGYNISEVKQGIFELIDLNYYKTANTGEFTPAVAGDYVLCGWIINSSVDDANKNDDSACKNITVLNQGQEHAEEKQEEQEELQKESEIEIIDADDVKFGGVIDVKIKVYRGDTRKYAVYAEIEGISKKTTMHFKDKFTNYTLTIPVQIKPNCDEKYSEGKYKLKVYGLGTSDSNKIVVSDFTKSLCRTENIIIEKNVTIEKVCNENLVERPENVVCLYQSYKLPKVIYESSSAKADRLTAFLIIGILGLLSGVLIWRR